MVRQKRMSTRRPAVYEVLLYHNNYPVKLCKVLNNSREGLFIETGSVTFPIDMKLEIGFEARVKDKLKRYRLPVKVAHITNGGMGLKIEKPSDNQFQIAQNIFHLVSTASHVLRNTKTTLNIL